jgi:hypothetical protein
MTAPIEIAISIPAAVDEVWEELSAIERHVDWMADAASLSFHGDQRRGAGTSFSCVTKIGPLRTTDEMTIDLWEECHRIGVTHRGAVTGSGVFELRSYGHTSTELVWREQLRFPWWLGGSLGELISRPVLHAVWRGNLKRLRSRVVGR